MKENLDVSKLNLDRLQFLDVLKEEREVINRLRRDDPEQTAKKKDEKLKAKPKAEADLMGYIGAQFAFVGMYAQRIYGSLENRGSSACR